MAEKETETKETVLKELKLKRKCARTKKKKIELYKKCKQNMKENIKNWKETKVSEEETLFGEIKEIAMLERRKKKTGRKIYEDKEELSILKSKSIRKVSTLVTNLEKSSEKPAETLLVPEITNLENVKSDQHSHAKVFGQITKNSITKPQPQYRNSRAAEARMEPVNSPPHQWERSSGDQEGPTRPVGQ